MVELTKAQQAVVDRIASTHEGVRVQDPGLNQGEDHGLVLAHGQAICGTCAGRGTVDDGSMVLIGRDGTSSDLGHTHS